ncbi:hypothetical protein L1049_019389 [Liquidambar formosana]|uniref:Gnk2-homologous domain-containing protein n=1 Tax=Liquidambar formosana TaxID=63359 RepID=A0AAP0S5N7_LIQFO
MDSSAKPLISLLSHTLIILFLCFAPFLPSVKSIPDYNSLVYKTCANQIFTTQSGDSYAQTLSSLFQALISQSSNSKFFKTTAGDEQTAMSGLFQCRGDISDGDCRDCVGTISEIANNLCGETVAARIQLFGCYMQYEYETDESSSPDNSGSPELLYKTCGESMATAEPSGFGEMMAAAFAAVESGVVSNNGFYRVEYEKVVVLAQCGGDLGGCDCGECVNNALQIAKDGCQNSVSGQIYMDSCFVIYTYYPDGIPGDSQPEGGGGGGGGNNTGKTMAIAVGAVAAIFFGFLFLAFLKSRGKKDEDY